MKKVCCSVAVSFLLLCVSCERAKPVQQEGVTMPSAPTGQAETLKQGEPLEGGSINVANLVLHPVGREAVTLTVEIAKTADERRQGLMGRENIPEKHGMWFVFESDVQDSFWMKDTPLSLDIIFVDKDYKVVDFIKDTVPNSETLLVPRAAYRYALEIKAGSVEAFGLGVNDRVEFRLGPP